MHLDLRAASSIASALASLRVALLFGGVFLLAESVVLATTFFAAVGLSFVASVLIGASIYRYRAPRGVDVQPHLGSHVTHDARRAASAAHRAQPAR